MKKIKKYKKENKQFIEI